MFGLRVHGQREIIRRFSLLEDAAAKKALRKATLAGAKVIIKAAQEKVPKRTWTLHDHIVAEAVKVEPDHVEARVGPDKEAFYGMFLELGTSKMAARPFLRPALDENQDKVEQAIWDELDRAIRKAVTE